MQTKVEKPTSTPLAAEHAQKKPRFNTDRNGVAEDPNIHLKNPNHHSNQNNKYQNEPQTDYTTTNYSNYLPKTPKDIPNKEMVVKEKSQRGYVNNIAAIQNQVDFSKEQRRNKNHTSAPFYSAQKPGFRPANTAAPTSAPSLTIEKQKTTYKDKLKHWMYNSVKSAQSALNSKSNINLDTDEFFKPKVS